MKINENYKNLSESYLFSTIAKKVAVYTQQHPKQEIIRLGIGDVTLPLAAPVVDALHAAVEEMGKKETFHGYGPEQGYGFLKQALMRYYARRGVVLAENEIFVGDGAKSDIGNILDLFDVDNTVLVPDPVYPVYVDTNVMAGRRIVYAAATRENGFLPMPQADVQADLIYLCSPNNPTGAAYSRDQLQAWVDYANERGAVLLFDAAYESFITDGDVPHSIYEVNGAETCAIEFCSFSKTAGFTGTRCSYTVVPQALVRGSLHLNAMWLRRQTTKYNGVPYIVQRAAAAVFTEEGQKATRAAIDYYRANAAVIAAALDEAGIWYCGGKNSPYIWMQCPGGMKSWDFFDHLLEHAGVVGTPGAGFGAQGEGYSRLTGSMTRKDQAGSAEAERGSMGAFFFFLLFSSSFFVRRAVSTKQYGKQAPAAGALSAKRGLCSYGAARPDAHIPAPPRRYRTPYAPSDAGTQPGKQADAAAQDHRHDRELVNVDEVKRHHPAGELRAAAHPDIPPGARFQAAYRLCRVLGRKTAFASGGGAPCVNTWHSIPTYGHAPGESSCVIWR